MMVFKMQGAGERDSVLLGIGITSKEIEGLMHGDGVWQDVSPIKDELKGGVDTVLLLPADNPEQLQDAIRDELAEKGNPYKINLDVEVREP